MAEQGKRLAQATGPSIGEFSGKIGLPFQKGTSTFLEPRLKIFNEIFATQKQHLSGLPKQEIVISLPGGQQIKGTSGVTTPAEVAKQLGQKILDDAIAAKVQYTRKVFDLESQLTVVEPEEQQAQVKLIDLTRPLEGDCELQLVNFDDQEGKLVFWHSSAHILGEALENVYGAHLCIGPPINPGFYYDAYLGNESLSQENYKEIDTEIGKIIKSKQKFERLVLTKDQALQIFQYNPFKFQLIKSKVPENGLTTAYRCGNLIDLCTGPHLPHTGKVKAMCVTKNSSAYWLGKAENDVLQRVYGVSYPSKEELKEYVTLQEEAAKRDHRTIGKNQDLFFFHQLSPGSCFFLPHGAIIFNRLIDFVRKEYKARNFTEVHSPNVYNVDLWKTSGHYDNYKDCMFMFEVEKQEFGLKPMNCPGHCLMFKHSNKSYRDLPVRFADFGVLHRNELSGALTGLTRVRRFQQDDAHIFCRQDQLMQEILNELEFLDYIYTLFGYTYELTLSTMPEKHLGSLEIWQQAEASLAEALNKFGKPWKVNPGDGAFYGPKIDVLLFDALKRKHQCGTIQCDFNLPIRFNLQYKGEQQTKEEGKQEEQQKAPEQPAAVTEVEGLKQDHHRPVIVHRALLGSIERHIAVLCEHTGGKWPFWLSPRQVLVVPVSDKFNNYAESIHYRFKLEGLCSETELSNNTLQKKVRFGQVSQFNFICVVGQEELESEQVDVRSRSNERIGKMTIQQFLKMCTSLLPPESKAWTQLRTKSFFTNLEELELQLSLNTFLSGNQVEQEDWVMYEKVKGAQLDNYPNINRWFSFLKNIRE